VFVFSFRTSFFGLRELPWLRRLGKRIVFVFHGSDARPAYIDGAWGRGDVLDAAWAAEVARLAARQRREIATIERHAHLVIAHPPMGQFFTRPFVPFLKVGIPVQAHRGPAGPSRAGDGVVRLVHSPSDPEAKGTAAIRAAVEEVRRRGVALDYVELTGRPHADVLSAIAASDIVLDQLYGDTPLAGFAAEAARQGKPALVAGYARDVWHLGLDAPERPPGVLCHPDEFVDVLEAFARDAARRASVGAAVRHFVEERWLPSAVAGRVLRLAATGTEGWTVDPRAVIYCEGAGAPVEVVRERVRRLVDAQGRGALQLADKPGLEEAMLAFARGGVGAGR
jgi:hypothetical protein